MKKLLIIALVIATMFSTSVVALGINSPSTSKGGGVITAMFATEDIGFLLGLEYGISEKFAVAGRVGLGDADFTKLAVKYEVSPRFAVLGGMYEYGFDSDPFFGINGSISFDRDIMGILEADVVMSDDTEIVYEAGVKYNINKQIDIRGGVLGSTYEGADNSFELGAGYKF